jgi:signal transduction histidine kinase
LKSSSISITQVLYGIDLGAQTAKELLESDSSQLTEPLDYVQTLARAGLAEMRALIFDLRPEALATEGPVAGLNKQVLSLRARHRLEVEANLIPEPAAPLEVKETVYRIAQEALHNVVKHARARKVELMLACTGARLCLDVRDDGIGFDPARPYPGHPGLASMRERTAQHGGKLDLESAPGAGTHVHVEIPLPSGRER